MHFVGRGQLDDHVLITDYRFLEEAKRVGDTAKRMKPPTPRHKLPHHLQTLVEIAGRREVRLHMLAPGMERRRCNTSRYDNRTGVLSWRVEWRFPAAMATAFDAKVNENAVLQDVLSKHLSPPPGETLKTAELEEYASKRVCDLRILLRKELTAANNPLYYRVNPLDTLKQVLMGKVIVEFPVFLVVFDKDLELYSLA